VRNHCVALILGFSIIELDLLFHFYEDPTQPAAARRCRVFRFWGPPPLARHRTKI
jgi:hypothetical protein